jgi:chromosome segregation ATPase
MARRFQALKADRDTLHAAYTEAQAKMERGVEELAALTTEVAKLREAASHAETESAQASATALAQVAAAHKTHAAAIELQSEQHKVALNDLRHELAENHTQEIDALRRKHTDELRARKSGHAEAIKSLKTVHKTKRASSLEALRLSVEAQREAEQVVHAEALAAVEESLEEARKDLEHSKAESTRRSQHVNETSQAEARARQEIGVLNFQVEHLREQLANMVHDDAARNRTTLDKMERDAAPLRDRIEMQKSEIRLLQNTVARECAERQSLVAALDTAKKTTAPTRKPGSRPSSVRLSGTPTRPMSSANRSPSATRRLPKLSKNQTV